MVALLPHSGSIAPCACALVLLDHIASDFQCRSAVHSPWLNTGPVNAQVSPTFVPPTASVGMLRKLRRCERCNDSTDTRLYEAGRVPSSELMHEKVKQCLKRQLTLWQYPHLPPAAPCILREAHDLGKSARAADTAYSSGFKLAKSSNPHHA